MVFAVCSILIYYIYLYVYTHIYLRDRNRDRYLKGKITERKEETGAWPGQSQEAEIPSGCLSWAVGAQVLLSSSSASNAH